MDDDRVKKLEDRIEQIIKDNKCQDKEIQEALIVIARNHIWKQSLYVKIKFWANLLGAIGVIGASVLFIVNFFGWEVRQR